jgi:predicted permease
MAKNLVRGVLGLVLTAAAAWLAQYIVDKVFGPDPDEQTA